MKARPRTGSQLAKGSKHPDPSGMTFDQLEKQGSEIRFSQRDFLHKLSAVEARLRENPATQSSFRAPLGETLSDRFSNRESQILTSGLVNTWLSFPRRNYLNLSPEEKDAFNNAVKAAIASGEYQALVAVHADMSHNMHGFSMSSDPTLGMLRFLSWHRAYLFEMESVLQKYRPYIRIPYWDWANDHQLPSWVYLPPGVTRGPDSKFKLPTQVMVDQQVLSQWSYIGFTSALEPGPFHNTVHMWVGGTMQDPMVSPKDPLFWLHHANIDRIWAQWQQSYSWVGGPVPMPHFPPPLAGVAATMDPWLNLQVDNLLDTYSLRYYYD